MHKITNANIKEWAKNYDGEPFDAILCDPPYELGFMGKSWDSSGIAFDTEMWTDLFRHIKPGGHLLAFSGSRTYHRMAVAIEDAGFEIRDMIEWVYGSGFPKSLNIGKAVDKIQGNEREVIGGNPNARNVKRSPDSAYARPVDTIPDADMKILSKGTSDYEGYGTALKPAHEPCVLARKPIEGTVANNVLKHGTGGLNIDGTRVGTEQVETGRGGRTSGSTFNASIGEKTLPTTGRFPANLIHDGSDEVEAVFPQTKKETSVGANTVGQKGVFSGNVYGKDYGHQKETPRRIVDNGTSASRFFYKVEYDNNSYDDTLKHAIMSVCKNTNVNSVVRFLRTIQATTESTAQWSATQSQREQLDQNVKSVANLSQECVTSIVQELVRIRSLVSNQQELTAFQHFTKNYKNDTPIQNLALIVEKWVNTDTIPTTTSLMKLFGCVLLATDENTKQENQENSNDTFRLIYTAKASKSERNAGLEGFEEKTSPKMDGGEFINPMTGISSKQTMRQNHHPTVKPLALTKYLATLIKPPTGGRLLVPFSGSGSEMIGALQAGWEYVEGVELTEEYIPIAEARIKHWLKKKEQAKLL